jgi:hypothetical protein
MLAFGEVGSQLDGTAETADRLGELVEFRPWRFTL